MRIKKRGGILTVAILISAASVLVAAKPDDLTVAGAPSVADWSQWRGSNRDGSAPDSPPLVENFPESGPKQLWVSEELPNGDTGGWGSPVAAGGKVYLYVNHNMPVKWRLLTQAALVKVHGYNPDMPAALSRMVEAARVSPERAQIVEKFKIDDGWLDPHGNADAYRQKLDEWVSGWIESNVKPEDEKFLVTIRARLKAGPNGPSLELLSALAPIADRKFDTQEDLEAWFKTAGLDGAAQKLATQLLTPSDLDAVDCIYCFDAGTGKTLWKTSFEGSWSVFPMSGTPAIANGKCYIWSSVGRVYCFDANTGHQVWMSQQFVKGGHHDSGSSVLLLDGLVVVPASRGKVFALDGADGKLKWAAPKIGHEQSSAGIWTKNGKKYILINANGQLTLLDPADGTELASMKSEGMSTPATAGDYGVCCIGAGKGVIGFKLALDKIEQTWNVPMEEGYTSPVINGDYVYAVGGGYGEAKKGNAICIELKTGKLLWNEPLFRAQNSSPLLADGKIIVPVWGDLLYFKAAPEHFTLLGRAKLGLERWASPAFAGGKVFVRTRKGVACYDLLK